MNSCSICRTKAKQVWELWNRIKCTNSENITTNKNQEEELRDREVSFLVLNLPTFHCTRMSLRGDSTEQQQGEVLPVGKAGSSTLDFLLCMGTCMITRPMDSWLDGQERLG